MFPSANESFRVGDQFTVSPNSTFNDTSCAKTSVPPRLSFQAHSAPLDAKFDADYSNLYVSFHGSWNRAPSAGYKLVSVPFTKSASSSAATQASGSLSWAAAGLPATNPLQPVANTTSTEGYTDIWWNQDPGNCSANTCFRPVGILVDSLGRLYVSSDSSGEGEIYLLGKA
jgi:hypothetical protein